MHLLCPRAPMRTCLYKRATRSRPKAIPFIEHQLPLGPASFTPVRHATHGAQGRANGPKNGPGKRLGAKKTGDEYVVTGNILFRQRGTHWFPGANVSMGRDHTIFAMASGYVRYYRDPFQHPKRQYIGVVFDKADTLPHPLHAARKRRLGMVSVPRRDGVGMLGEGAEGRDGVVNDGSVLTGLREDARSDNEIGLLSTQVSGLSIADQALGVPSTAPTPSKRAIKEAKRKQATGRIPGAQLPLRPDYSYRESNWQIGRAAERAGVMVKKFRTGDRFLAWRKRGARIARNAEKRAMGKKKGKKDKPARGGTRKGVGQPLA